MTIASQRSRQWHACSTLMSSDVTVEEALRAADLDWGVETAPAGFMLDGKFVEIDNKRVTMRDDTHAPFDVVGRSYKTWDNVDAFAFVDHVLGSTGLSIEACGSLGGGRKVFLVAKLPDTMLVGGEDAYDMFLFLMTSHDGKSSIRARVTPLRLRCTNQFGAQLRNSTVTTWAIPHTSTAEGKLIEARNTLQLSFSAADAFSQELNKMLTQSITDTTFADLIRTTLPDTKTRDQKITDIIDLRHTSETIDADWRMTNYGAVQAFTEWLDWGRRVNTEVARFTTSFDGYGASWRQRIMDELAVS